jgi:apolipoprotein N-acyltransferase
MAAAWPPLPLGFLAYIALIRPLDIISGKPFGKAFQSGYLFSFVYHLCALYWIGWVHVPGMVAAVAIISLYHAFMFGLYSSVYRRRRILALVLFPLLWVGVEYFRSLFEIAFPWANLSYTQGSYTPLLQICEFVGDGGITLLIVVVNILLWQAWKSTVRSRKAVLAMIAGLIVIIPTIYGAIVLSHAGPVGQGSIRIGLLQGNVPLETKWDPQMEEFNLNLYDSLALAAGPTDLLIWPETAAPAYLRDDYKLLSMVEATAKRVGAPMLVGTLDYDRPKAGEIDYFNAAIQFTPDGGHSLPYHKNKLVPFAETVPYGKHIPWLANLSIGWSDFAPGKELRLYETKAGKYGTLICYESIFPEVCNRYVDMGADFLVNITIDTWYGNSSGPYQHAGMPIFRAIENRISIARAANSGISYFVDSYGRIYDKSGLYEKKVIVGNIAPRVGRTLFNRLGPVLGQTGLLLIALLTLILPALWFKNRLSH